MTVVACAIGLAACASPEQPLLERFFDASRLRDKTALHLFATVIFEPREDGIVRRFSIVNISPERMHDGVVTKEVTLRAPVVTPKGPIVDETLIVTLQQTDERQAGYRWMVVGVRDAAGSRTAPRL